MCDEPDTRIDHPERLCHAIVAVLEELQQEEIIEEERASELRSQIYRSISTRDKFPEE